MASWGAVSTRIPVSEANAIRCTEARNLGNCRVDMDLDRPRSPALLEIPRNAAVVAVLHRKNPFWSCQFIAKGSQGPSVASKPQNLIDVLRLGETNIGSVLANSDSARAAMIGANVISWLTQTRSLIDGLLAALQNYGEGTSSLDQDPRLLSLIASSEESVGH
jgi:hypothetical protein